MNLTARRKLGFGLLVLAAAVFWVMNFALVTHLRRAAVYTGLSLMALVLFLTLFNARKKVPFVPLLPASVWMQIHIYAGFLSVIVFGLHIGWKVPQGTLETLVALLFLAVAGSGVAGIFISRWLPPRLAVHGENVIFERIPALRATVRQEAEELAVQSVSATHSSTIADFYELKLRDYFARPQAIWHHIIGNRKPLFRLLSDIEGLDRYLNAREREIMAQIAELVHAKNNLDYQLAGQGVLKGWLFIHIPLTYALIVFAIAHGMLAWVFS